MNAARPRVRYWLVALCALAGPAALALMWWGITPLTAVAIAIAIACPLAMLYAWWLGRRALRPLDNAGCTSSEQNSHDHPRRTP